MYWTFTAGLCVIDVDRVDTDENGTGLDQVRGCLTAEVRRAGGVPRGAEVPIPAGVCRSTAVPRSYVHRRFRNPGDGGIGVSC